MNAFISLFLPSLVGYKIFLNMNKKKKFTVESKIFYYLMFLLFSNYFSIIIARLFFNLNSNLETTLYMYPIFLVKYVFVCLIFNIILSIVFSFVKEVSLTIKITKDKKKNVKKSNKRRK